MAYDAAGERMWSARDTWLTGEVQVWVEDPHGGGHLPGLPPGDGGEGGGGGHYETREASYRGERREEYGYTAEGALASVATLESGYVDTGSGTAASTGVTDRFGGNAAFQYDAMGRQTRQTDTDEHGLVVLDRQTGYSSGGLVLAETTTQRQGSDTVTSVTGNDYGAGYGAAGNAALGQVVRAQVASSRNGQPQGVGTTANAYTWRQGAELASSSVSGPGASSTTYAYGAGGALESVSLSDGRPRTVSFVNDLSGQALRRDESDNIYNQGDPHEAWYRFAGVEIGHVGNNAAAMPDYASSVDLRSRTPGTAPFANPDPRYDQRFARTVEHITSYDTGSAAATWTVRAGDTLAGIAAQLWGDAGLWYKLARANGISGDGALPAGRILSVPAGVVRSTYNASTFTPFDPADTLGDLSPLAPQPTASAARKTNKCGAFGQILLVAVAVAVSVALPGGGSVIGAAINGAIGSAVSQGVGLATGIQDRFSWTGVALAGIGAGVGAALGGGTLIGGIKSGFVSDVVNGAARGVVGNVATQGIALATGLQSKFDFAGVAAAGVAGGIGGGLGRSLKLSSLKLDRSAANIAGHALAGTARAIAGGAARSLIDGSDFGDNVLAALPDAIGQTIGEAVGERIASARESFALEKDLIARAEKSASAPIAPWLKVDPAALADGGMVTGGTAIGAATTGGAITEDRYVPREVYERALAAANAGTLRDAAGRPTGAPKTASVTLDVLDGFYRGKDQVMNPVPSWEDAARIYEGHLGYYEQRANDTAVLVRVHAADLAVAQFDHDVLGLGAFVLTTAATAAFEPVNIAYTGYQYGTGRIGAAEATLALVPGARAFGKNATGLRGVERTLPKGWSVGDDIYTLTKSGTQPAWSTVRGRFWKNEAASPLVGTWNAENLDRMSNGMAPQRFNFDKGGLESMELSHEPIPFRDGGKTLVPRWPQDHAAVDPFRHPGY